MVRTRIKVDKRQAILEAAGRLLARRRFAEVSLEDVAAEANVAKGTLYLYFDSKDAIYLAYVGQMIEPLVSSLKHDVPVAAEKSAIAAVGLMITELMDCARRNPAIQDIMQGTSRASQQAAHQKTKAAFRQMIVDVLAAGMQSGELRTLSPELCADVILAAAARTLEHSVQKPKQVQTAAKQVIELLTHGLLATHATPALSETP